MNLNDLILCKLAPSKIHGIGVFAIKDIFKGQKLYCYPQKRVCYRKEDFLKLGDVEKELVIAQFPSVVVGGMFLLPHSIVDLICYMNHSDDYNYDNDTDLALRDIQAGEEITENYRVMDHYKLSYPWLE
jgi:hypothetical protein